MPDDIDMNVASVMIRSIRCTDLTPCKGFVLMLGNYSNSQEIAVAEPRLKSKTVYLNTDAGFNIFLDEQIVCFIHSTIILCNQNIETNGNFIKGARTPVERADAATKVYVDRVHYKIATRTISGADHTNHTLVTFPSGKIVQVES